MSNLKKLNGHAFKALYKEELALSQPQIARALGYTTRQVRNLENSEGGCCKYVYCRRNNF